MARIFRGTDRVKGMLSIRNSLCAASFFLLGLSNPLLATTVTSINEELESLNFHETEVERVFEMDRISHLNEDFEGEWEMVSWSEPVSQIADVEVKKSQPKVPLKTNRKLDSESYSGENSKFESNAMCKTSPYELKVPICSNTTVSFKNNHSLGFRTESSEDFYRSVCSSCRGFSYDSDEKPLAGGFLFSIHSDVFFRETAGSNSPSPLMCDMPVGMISYKTMTGLHAGNKSILMPLANRQGISKIDKQVDNLYLINEMATLSKDYSRKDGCPTENRAEVLSGEKGGSREKRIEKYSASKIISLWLPNRKELHSTNFSTQCENCPLRSMTMKSASVWKSSCSLAKTISPLLQSKYS